AAVRLRLFGEAPFHGLIESTHDDRRHADHLPRLISMMISRRAAGRSSSHSVPTRGCAQTRSLGGVSDVGAYAAGTCGEVPPARHRPLGLRVLHSAHSSPWFAPGACGCTPASGADTGTERQAGGM